MTNFQENVRKKKSQENTKGPWLFALINLFWLDKTPQSCYSVAYTYKNSIYSWTDHNLLIINYTSMQWNIWASCILATWEWIHTIHRQVATWKIQDTFSCSLLLIPRFLKTTSLILLVAFVVVTIFQLIHSMAFFQTHNLYKKQISFLVYVEEWG